MRINVEFMNAGRSAYSRPPVARPKDSGLFWWTIIITLLLGAAIASWFFSIYVFAYPEKPFNYRVLGRLKKIPDLTDFEIASAPPGAFLGPKAAFQKFDPLSDAQLKAKSELFRRAYITNYKDSDEKAIYLKGDFKIYQVRPLTEADVFPRGLVVRAQAVEKVDDKPLEYPNTIIEFVFPTEQPASASFNVGDILAIDQKSVFAKSGDGGAEMHRSFASVLNIQRLPDQKLLFTVVPLLYGTYDIDPGKELRITLAPPKKLNMDGRWPLTDEAVGLTGALLSPVPASVADLTTPTQ